MAEHVPGCCTKFQVLRDQDSKLSSTVAIKNQVKSHQAKQDQLQNLQPKKRKCFLPLTFSENRIAPKQESRRSTNNKHKINKHNNNMETTNNRTLLKEVASTHGFSVITREAKANSVTVEGYDKITPEQLATIANCLNEDSSDDDDYDDMFVGY